MPSVQNSSFLSFKISVSVNWKLIYVFLNNCTALNAFKLLVTMVKFSIRNVFQNTQVMLRI